jgi:hypothetical protein
MKRTDRFYVAQAAQSAGGLYLDPLGRFTADLLKAARFVSIGNVNRVLR